MAGPRRSNTSEASRYHPAGAGHPHNGVAAAAAQASQPHFLLNPFLSSLDDPAGLDSKLGGLKDSGRDVFKLMSQIASHTANLKSPGGQGAS